MIRRAAGTSNSRVAERSEAGAVGIVELAARDLSQETMR